MKIRRRQFLQAITAAVAVAPMRDMMTLHADEASSPALAFRQAGNEFHFDTDVLRGTLRAAGRSRGLGPVQHIATGKQLAGALGLLSPYRLLTPESRFGTAA